MSFDTIYEEDIPSIWMTRILTFTIAVFLLLFVHLQTGGAEDDNPVTRVLFPILSLFFLGLLLTLRSLSVRMTNDNLTVAYGPISYSVPLENITEVRVDETSALRYGGAGIRLAPVGGKLRLVFSVIGGQRVVLGIRGRRIGELVFSTERPDEVVKLIRERTAE